MAKKSSAQHGWPPLPQPLPHPVADAHCHLDLTRDDLADTGGITPSGTEQPNRGADSATLSADELLARAAQVNVTRAVHIGCEVQSSAFGVQLAARHPAVAAAVAIHPNEAPGLAKAGRLGDALSQIEALALAHPKVRALGETGLDYFRTDEQGRPAQHESFRAHIEMAKRHNKTLAIHDRDAHEDVIATLLEVGAPERVIFHCYSGDAAMAQVCAQHGWYLSFAGNVTFGNAAPLREALAVVPPHLLLVETDAPFLTPTPYRGQPNASYLIPVTVRAMAALREVDEVTLCEQLDANTSAAYGGAW